jgi:DNA polymerase/3'-5' exonuclease PolX
MATDYREQIIHELRTLCKKETDAKNPFKAIAYTKVIVQLEKAGRIETIDDMANIKGIGKGIRDRIVEIMTTGHLLEAEVEREGDQGRLDMIDLFKEIHGIGQVKATRLVDVDHMDSIDALRAASKADASLLNPTQKKGLEYHEAFLERIPRAEMKAHSKIVKKIMKKAYPTLELDILGSYRRGEATSGDIDVMIKLPADKAIDFGKMLLTEIVEKLRAKRYIIDTLALGQKKFMGVARVGDNTPRRIDIMVTPEANYGFALMYFTGSMDFNIGVRRVALEKGYSMNEHGLTPMSDTVPHPPVLASEADIFDFLGLKTIKPKKRIDATSVKPKKS